MQGRRLLMLASMAVGAWFPAAQADSESFTIRPDSSAGIPIELNGVTSDAPWQLTHLNDPDGASLAEYHYPESTAPVRLYLIDTAVKNPNGWFKGNPKLTLGSPISVDGGPSVAFNHGTRILSIIAGPGTGAALGTPIEVVNLDIYPDGEAAGSSVGLTATAVYDAVVDHISRDDSVPGVICIASGSSQQAKSAMFLDAVKVAVSRNLVVVVSAGNEGSEVSNFIPGAYGNLDGVISVGASNAANQRIAMSNHGASVDFLAPGEAVRTLRLPTPASGAYGTMTGTSAAAALATAAVLTQRSICPDLSPKEIEAHLKNVAFKTAAGPRLIQVPEQDTDGDGVPDTIETFFGTCPFTRSDCPVSPIMECSSGVAALGFGVNAELFQRGTPYRLSDGRTWSVLVSPDCKTWKTATGELLVGSTSGGRTSLQFCSHASTANGYFRIRVSPGGATP